ncbi:MAG: hypothetical protein ACUVWP_09645 [bacterium]
MRNIGKFFILILAIILISKSIINGNLITTSERNNHYSISKTTKMLYYDDSQWNVCYGPRSYLINEPFENGFGFYFDLADFDFMKNIKIFKIIEISAHVMKFHTDEETVEVLCGGIGLRGGPKGPLDVLFAVPDDGITVDDIPYEKDFYWVTCNENDGSWGIDDGAKYDYNGLPVIYDRDKYRNEYGVWLWVAKLRHR